VRLAGRFVPAGRFIMVARHTFYRFSTKEFFMSDQQTTQPFFNIQRIYLKDLSLEQPNSPGIFLETEMPSVEVEVDVKAEKLAEGVFESIVTGTITAKVKDKVAFLVEAKQGGIFDIRNIPADQLDPLLGIACPTILFPYLRSNIADMVTRAGFPPIHLAEINFQALYEQRLAQFQAQQAATSGGDNPIVIGEAAPGTH
jgi:preprotein translocase subunit SecB